MIKKNETYTCALCKQYTDIDYDVYIQFAVFSVQYCSSGDYRVILVVNNTYIT